MNRVVLIGRLVRDVELRYTLKGTAVASFRLAVNRNFKNKDGEQEADFINIVAWKRLGENAAKYVGKGSQVGISGRIQTRSYKTEDGQNRYVVEVAAEEIEFLDSRKSKTENTQVDKDNSNTVKDDFVPLEEDDDDLPF